MANWKYEIGERIVKTDDKGNVIIDCVITGKQIDGISCDGNQLNMMNIRAHQLFYEYTCNICGAEHLWKVQQGIERDRCGCCSNRIRVRGINTIGDLHPGIEVYFDEDDAYNTNLKSSDRYDVRCPICKHTKNMKVEKLIKDGLSCDYCNSIENKRPDLIKYLISQYDSRLPFASNKRVLVKCPDCGDEKYMIVKNLSRQGFRCAKCGDGVSFPEKFLSCVLMQLGVDFVAQVTSRTLSWIGNYRYDFYIPNKNIIIEAHGAQHYRDNSSPSQKWRTLEEEQENDRNKESLAKRNGVNDYIVLDCRLSELNWIKNSILNSSLNQIYDLSSIDWLRCVEFSMKNLVREVCSYWSSHNNLTTGELAKLFRMNQSTILQYLKSGTELGWCNYSVERELMKRNQLAAQRIISTRSKRVVVLKNDECVGIFDSLSELERKSEETYGVYLNSSNTSDVCLGRKKQYKGFVFRYIDGDHWQL